jgi:hypothetical protein
MLLTLALGLTLADGLLGAQHGRADGEGQQHRNRHDDFLRVGVVLFEVGLELVDFTEQLLLAEGSK